jgi:molecular chaperone GrpE
MAKRDDRAPLSERQEPGPPGENLSSEDRQGVQDSAAAERSTGPERTHNAREEPVASGEAAIQAEEEQESQELVEISAEEVARLQAEKEEYYDRLLRLKAEFENYKKRVQRDLDRLRKYAAEAVIEPLLHVLDNFERALSTVPEGVNDGFRKGMEIIHNQLCDALARAGLSPMESVGQKFDPHLHDAVMQLPSDDYEEGTVVEEFNKGYMLFDKVIRHAKVAVSSGSANGQEPDDPWGQNAADEQE